MVIHTTILTKRECRVSTSNRRRNSGRNMRLNQDSVPRHRQRLRRPRRPRSPFNVRYRLQILMISTSNLRGGKGGQTFRERFLQKSNQQSTTNLRRISSHVNRFKQGLNTTTPLGFERSMIRITTLTMTTVKTRNIRYINYNSSPRRTKRVFTRRPNKMTNTIMPLIIMTNPRINLKRGFRPNRCFFTPRNVLPRRVSLHVYRTTKFIRSNVQRNSLTSIIRRNTPMGPLRLLFKRDKIRVLYGSTKVLHRPTKILKNMIILLISRLISNNRQTRSRLLYLTRNNLRFNLRLLLNLLPTSTMKFVGRINRRRNRRRLPMRSQMMSTMVPKMNIN